MQISMNSLFCLCTALADGKQAAGFRHFVVSMVEQCRMEKTT